MIEKIVYVADDGKEFETEEECIAYENRDSIHKILDAVTLYNIDGERINRATVFENFIELFNSYLTKYLIIDSSANEEDLIRFSSFLYNVHGVEFPTCAGKYRWDSDKENWVEFEEDIRNFKAMWDSIIKLEIKTR